MNSPHIKVLVLPGGRMLEPGRTGDVGFDVHTRGIVTTETDPDYPYMFKTVWNLQDSPPPSLKRDAIWKDDRWIYLFRPGTTLRLGVGLVLGGESFDWYACTELRTSTGNKLLTNFMSGIPWDPNYRSEGTVFLGNNGRRAVEVHHGWRPVQLVFHCKCCKNGWVRPTLQEVKTRKELGDTVRQNKWNSSSDARSYQPELQLLLTDNHHMEAVGK